MRPAIVKKFCAISPAIDAATSMKIRSEKGFTALTIGHGLGSAVVSQELWGVDLRIEVHEIGI